MLAPGPPLGRIYGVKRVAGETHLYQLRNDTMLPHLCCFSSTPGSDARDDWQDFTCTCPTEQGTAYVIREDDCRMLERQGPRNGFWQCCWPALRPVLGLNRSESAGMPKVSLCTSQSHVQMLRSARTLNRRSPRGTMTSGAKRLTAKSRRTVLGRAAESASQPATQSFEATVGYQQGVRTEVFPRGPGYAPGTTYTGPVSSL